MYITQGGFLSAYSTIAHFYFGQPSGGLRFTSDRLMARRQSPLTLSVSAFGPGLAFDFAFFVFFI